MSVLKSLINLVKFCYFFNIGKESQHNRLLRQLLVQKNFNSGQNTQKLKQKTPPNPSLPDIYMYIYIYICNVWVCVI
jgi:hypothetical protein